MLGAKGISKSFPGVRALDDITVEFRTGEVHALLGENGAGKSTLIKILAGAQSADEGEILVNESKFPRLTPESAFDHGIVTIYQEFNLIPELTVAENIFFGREMRRGPFIDKRAMRREAQRLCDEIGVTIDPNSLVKHIGVAQQQIVEIVKAMSRNGRYLIMDEPTAPLTNSEIDLLFRLISRLKERGTTTIFITHRLEEVFRVCDRVTVLRDGKHVATEEIADTTTTQLIQWMVGRELTGTFPPAEHPPGEVLLEVERLSGQFVSDITFQLRRGEILGVAGLVGSGRTSMARVLFGADDSYSGVIKLSGRERKISSPEDSIRHGIGLLPEDRKQHGLILGFPVVHNITYASLHEFTRRGFINRKAEDQQATASFTTTRIKASSHRAETKTLSGGNQQKVVLAKWLTTECEVLIFDEPTRGIDVGAKAEIYRLLRALTDKGKAIIMISSEMPELIGMADRILVMCEGRVSGHLERSEFSQHSIMEYASLPSSNKTQREMIGG